MKKVVGVVNFSTLCKKNAGSFISSREQEWELHVQKTLDDERLKLRTKLFCEISIPQLDLQVYESSLVSFELVVLISEILPDVYKNELYDLSKIRPWLVIEERKENDWLDARGAIRRSVARLTEKDSGEKHLFASFRLDDDDFLSINYLHKLSGYISEGNLNKFVTFPIGKKCVWKNNKIVNLAEFDSPLIAIGLAHIGLYNKSKDELCTKPESVFAGINHYEINKDYEVIEDRSESMYFWSQHSFQDTAGRFKHSEINEFWDDSDYSLLKKFKNFPILIPKIDLSRF